MTGTALIGKNSIMARIKLEEPGRLAAAPPTIRRVPMDPHRQWLISPAIDIFFCCGGLVWLLFVFHYFVVGANATAGFAPVLALCTIAGTHALGETHIAATLARVYRTPQSTAKFAPYTRWAAAGFVLLAIAGLLVDGLTPMMAKLYLLWVPIHFTGQTYGMSLMYMQKGNYKIGNVHKRMLWLMMHATAIFAILRMLTYKEWNADGFLAQRIPFWGPLPEQFLQTCTAALALSAAAFAICVLKKAVMERQMMPLPALLMIATGVAVFVLGKDLAGTLWLYVPAFYHGSQYVVLSTSYYLRESGRADKVPAAEFSRLFGASAGLRYMGLLLVLALSIYVAVPRLLGEVGFSYSLSFATIFVAFNLHHFVTDAAIWKMRDPEVRRNLVGS